MNKNFEEFIQRMDANLGYKSVILPLLPCGAVKILDVGGGTGVLSHQMKLSNPFAEVTLLDCNSQMLQVAKENKTADFYKQNIYQLENNYYDVIVFCSVLHELQDWKEFMFEFLPKLSKRGQIIIRDGMREESWDKDSVRLRNPQEAKTFYEACGDSVVGNLKLEFFSERLYGDKNDIRSFLQTYTWGWESMHREKNENHLFASYSDVARFFMGQEEFDIATMDYTEICQQNYFKHLNKIIDVEYMWNTHMLFSIKKEEI